MFKLSSLILTCSIIGIIGVYFFVHIRLVQTQIEPTPFLYAPYFGTKSINAVFDHEYPRYIDEIDYPGDPSVIPTTIMHNDGNRYDDNDTDSYGYSGHDGIDYSLSYEYVLAAHNGTITEAGWQTPGNRRNGLGLMIKITDGNAYETVYGHLSVILSEIEDKATRSTVIGISGNTGNSTGPHLHFKLEPPNSNYAVNPYGWYGQTPDPWEATSDGATSYDLWDEYPSIINDDIYSSGSPISLPSTPNPPLTPDLTNPTNVLIDNDPRFERFGGPWSFRLCTAPQCYGTSFFYTSAGLLYTFARWQPHRNELVAGKYDLYAYIPSEHRYANSTLAYYKIYHNQQIHSAGIDQTRFNNPPGYPRTWAYLGRYDFSGSLSTEKVEIYRSYNPEDPNETLAADALIFVLADGPPDVTLDITVGSDDAGPEPGQCLFNPGYAEIYLGYCDNNYPIVSGFRYATATIPEWGIITRAHLQFSIDGPTSNELQLLFYGENATNSLTFSTNNQPANRPLTSSYIHWYIPQTDEWLWINPFEKRFSPDLTPIVQEIIELDGWTSGISAVTIIVIPDPLYITDSRRVMAFERDPGNGEHDARLFIWYECPGGGPPCPQQ